jgi:Xaa-Pro dipeptidase
MANDRPDLIRRALVTGTALLGTGSMLARALAAPAQAGVAAAQRVASLPTRFSVAERDRRWTRVRDMMRREKFDCLLTPAGTDAESSADTRYLTQRAGWLVFPLDGPPALVIDRREPPALDEWVKDARVADDGLWSPTIIEALGDAKMAHARIGIGRLVDAPRSREGDVSFTTLDRLRQAFPNARFESATDPLVRVKLVRSDEEIALLTRVTEASERGIDALMRVAVPGAWHKDVWLAVFTALHEATGEPPSRLAMRGGAEANTSTGGPMLERLAYGQIVNQEIAAQALGYMAQVNHSIVIGKPPAAWPSAARYCVELLNELVEWIRPGRRFMDLCRLYADRAVARTPGLAPTWVLVHTCGLGDGPRMGVGRSETPDLIIEPTMVFTLKPRIVMPGVSPSAQFGDPILVTEKGARRLGRRTLYPLASHG